jgi:hypothetical protein
MHQASPVRGWCRVEDAIHGRVAQIHVRRGHVDLRPQGAAAVGKLAPAHAVEAGRDSRPLAIAKRAVAARLFERAAIGTDLVGGQVAHVGVALLDELPSPIVHLLEIVRGVADAIGQVIAQPPDVRDDGVDVFLLLLDRVGVVETEEVLPVVALGQPEIQVDALGMPDVQVAVGLRRKPSPHPPAPLAVTQVGFDDLLDEIEPSGSIFPPVSPTPPELSE